MYYKICTLNGGGHPEREVPFYLSKNGKEKILSMLLIIIPILLMVVPEVLRHTFNPSPVDLDSSPS